MPEGLAQRVDRAIRTGEFAGAAVAGSRSDGRPLLEHVAGEAAPGLAASGAVLWPIASISKLFTTAMVMRLVEDGELTLDTRVGAVLPAFVGDGRDEVLLRHLLTHTSGLRYESPDLATHLRAHVELETLIDEACVAPLLFRPGTAFNYSDDGFLLAGRMSEVVTGTSYADLVRTWVTDPMTLESTFVVPSEADEGRLANVRGVLAEGTDGAMYNTRSARALAHPAFGVFCSVGDLVRFGTHFAPGGPRIHAEATVRAMTTAQSHGVQGMHPSVVGRAASSIPWGLGFELQTEDFPGIFSRLGSTSSYGHGGATGCQLVIDPPHDLVVVVLTNTHILTGPAAWLACLGDVVDAAYREAARFT